MNNLKKIWILFVTFSCFACNKNGPHLLYGNIQIHYIDPNYDDLFTDGSNGYIFDSIRAYDFGNGIKIPLSTASNTYPYGFSYNPRHPTSGILIGNANANLINRYSLTIIHLKMGVDDTLRLHYEGNLDVNYADIDSVFYNGKYFRYDSISIMKFK